MTKSKASTKAVVLTCSVCNRTIEGRKQYSNHLRGQSHIKNVENQKSSLNVEDISCPPAKTSIPSTKSPPPVGIVQVENGVQQFSVLPNKQFLCNVCNVVCSEQKSLQSHFGGAKHKKNVKTASCSPAEKLNIEVKKSVSDEKCKTQPVAENEDQLKGFLGHEFLETKRNEKGVIVSYYCGLCGIFLNGFSSFKSHMQGRRHKQNYKSQVDGNIVVPPRSMKRMEKKQTEKMDKQQAKEEFWREKENHEESKKIKSTQASKNKKKKKKKKNNDKYLLTTCESIGMDPHRLATLLWFCECCEIALKFVSDEFLSRDGHSNVDDSRRTLTGTMRVGILCNMQILNKDKDFRMVLLLSTKPTLSLLKRIHRSFQYHLETVLLDGNPNEQKTDFEVAIVPEKACLTVNMVNPFQFNITISITSHLIQENNPVCKDEADLLSMESCLESLQELRRADWFQSRLQNLNAGLNALKILRHLRMEYQTCSYISEWANELLIEKCILIRGATSGPSNILRSYFELLSSGLLFDGPGLQDPCELNQVDLFKDLTEQQREDVTLFAQNCLRLVAFVKPHEFFEKQINLLKRKSSSQNDRPPPKKAKLEDHS